MFDSFLRLSLNRDGTPERLPIHLADLPDGARGRVLRLAGEPLLRERLAELGFTPGQEVRALRRAPLGDPLEVEVRGTRLAIRVDEAEGVLLEAPA